MSIFYNNHNVTGSGLLTYTSGNFTSNLGIGTNSPTQQLHVSGNLRLTGGFYDSNNSAGTTDQVLISNGSGVVWTSGSAITKSSYYTAIMFG